MEFKEINFEDIEMGKKVYISDKKEEYTVIGIGKEGAIDDTQFTRIFLQNDLGKKRDLMKGRDKIFIQK